jgi:transposase
MVEETFLPGNSVSLVARMHGVAPNQLFGWRRQAASGALTATRAGGEVVPASEYRALENQVRELQRMLGKKTMENEILREAISRVAGPKKTPLRTLSLPEGDLCRCRMYSPQKCRTKIPQFEVSANSLRG